MEPSGDAVKEPASARKAPAPPPGFARHFEGWELGAVTVGLVLAASLLAVPRAAEPVAFPVPLVDVVEERATHTEQNQLADRAESEGLPFETRAVGDALRRLGLALAGTTGDPEHVKRVLSERVQLALAAKQSEALSQLRAVQTRYFIQAVQKHAPGSPPSDELAALGGDFSARASQNGWLGADGFVGSEAELATLFAVRWTELTRLRDVPELRLKLAVQRRYYRFLLLHPERSKDAEDRGAERARLRLRYAEALAQRDGNYPISLTRGVLLGQLGLGPQAAQSLSGYLARPGETDWRLRARNYLLATAEGASDEP